MRFIKENNIVDICEKHGIREAYIFGSEITGFKHPGSDLDFGIILKKGLPPAKKRMKIYGEIFSDFSTVFSGKKLDLVFLEEVPLHFQFKVLTEGMPVYMTDLEESYNHKEKIINLYRDYKYFIDEFYKGLLEAPA